MARCILLLRNLADAILVLILLIGSIRDVYGGTEGEKDEKKYDENYLYLENAGSVIEFRPEMDPDPKRPSFLYGPDTGPRLVEFYAPWCPHCRKFRDHYLELAQQLTDFAKEVGAPKLSFYAVSCKVHKKICSTFKINGYPQLKTFPAGATTPSEMIKHNELHPSYILNSLQVQTDHLKTLGDSAMSDNAKQSYWEGASRALSVWLQPEEERYHPRTKQQVFDDAYRAFDLNLRRDIYTSSDPLSQEAKKALFQWLTLLQKTMPVTWKIQSVLRAVLDDFDEAASGKDHLLQILNPYPTPAGDWSPACTKGQAGMGYTCGLWQLIHIMSIGLVEWNQLVPSGPQHDKRMAVSTNEAGDMLRNFMFHFSGCEVCRTNFLKSYDECHLDRCNRLDHRKILRHWKKLPDYLFELHNTVNVELMKDKVQEDHSSPTAEDAIKKKWPRREDCPKCWQEDGKWDEEAVYMFLRIEYWPEDSTTDLFRKKLGIDKASLELAAAKSGTDMTSYSPLFAVWVVSGILVATIIWRKKIVRERSGFHKKIDEA